ncbi:MAG: hypothetical protein AVDCRST_MAG85-3475 [uncultured Solirubrobacteraceae bacterium]|uniref:Uncharacterized protein n=1 Tax=uncultured Solirubrobacteraceae bacterium TaxID=1162706 RepID=A0A6J4TQF7_9ACTN|nr:MAG: hypothetical protein AVDCRST_MAG85-3475 [uncultured Solirubrobacteraceae bacterium]
MPCSRAKSGSIQTLLTCPGWSVTSISGSGPSSQTNSLKLAATGRSSGEPSAAFS